MIGERCFILTGAFGSGKSTLLAHLPALGLRVVAEPARQILAEQRGIGGDGIPGRDAGLFVNLLLSRAIDDFARASTSAVPVVFDRGIPDVVGYAAHFGLDFPPARNAARIYRYNSRVFFAPAWEQIYTTDDERTLHARSATPCGPHTSSWATRRSSSPAPRWWFGRGIFSTTCEPAGEAHHRRSPSIELLAGGRATLGV
jgi:predicted ATPase